MGCQCIGPSKDVYSIENILGEKIKRTQRNYIKLSNKWIRQKSF